MASVVWLAVVYVQPPAEHGVVDVSAFDTAIGLGKLLSHVPVKVTVLLNVVNDVGADNVRVGEAVSLVKERVTVVVLLAASVCAIDTAFAPSPAEKVTV